MMKKISFALAASLLLLACNNKPAPQQRVSGTNEYAVSDEQEDGIHRMPDYNYSETVQTDGRTYVYTIHREASDSLPIVTDDEGNRYADNVYTLTIRTGEQTFFQRRFTKASFTSYLSKGFAEKGILDGMMCDQSLSGLCFAVSVSLPQSDMFEPLLIRVDANGGLSITHDERGEAEMDTEIIEEGV